MEGAQRHLVAAHHRLPRMIALSYTRRAGLYPPGMTVRPPVAARLPILGTPPRKPRFQAGRSVNFANFRASFPRSPS